MLHNFKLFRDVTGENLDEMIKSSTGLKHDEFTKKLHDKKHQKYLLSTQNKNNCIQKCDHCFMVEFDQEKEETAISESDLDYLFDAYTNRGYKTYMYYQEPILRDDYFEKLEKYPQEIAEINPVFFLKKKYRDKINKSPIKEIKHSIHGDAETHALLTNTDKDFYQKMIEGMKIIKDMGLRLGVETTFYDNNKHCVGYLIDKLEQIRADDWYIGRVIPVGRAINWPIDKFLTGDEAKAVLVSIARGIESKKFKINIKFESGWGPNFYSSWYYRYLLGEIDREVVKSIYYCDAINSHMAYLSVDSGDVYPCFYYLTFPEETIGKWNPEEKDIKFDDKATVMWAAEKLRERLRGICSRDSCIMNEICIGGCRAEATAFATREGLKCEDAFYAGMNFCIKNEIRKELQITS